MSTVELSNLRVSSATMTASSSIRLLVVRE